MPNFGPAMLISMTNSQYIPKYTPPPPQLQNPGENTDVHGVIQFSDGNVLFIVELHPVCRLLTPNLTKVGAVDTASRVARQHTAERDGFSGQGRERQSAAGSRRVLLRKKLSFSKALKNNSPNLEAVGNPPRMQIPVANSNSSSENSISHSTLSKEPLPSIMNTPSPSMVAIGLVKQSDLPLSWLDPTSVFSCNGLYVPRGTRNTLSQSLLKENERFQLDHGETSTKKSANLSTNDNSPEPPGENSTPLPCILASPYYQSMNISPVVRLDKFSFSSPDSSQNSRSAQTDHRRRRTASVPKDILCSLSNDKESRKTMKLSRIKSVPSSPMVLCTKLPLLRHQDGSKPPLSLVVSPKILQCKIRELQESVSLTTGGDVTQKLGEHVVSSSVVNVRQFFQDSVLQMNHSVAVERNFFFPGQCPGNGSISFARYFLAKIAGSID